MLDQLAHKEQLVRLVQMVTMVQQAHKVHKETQVQRGTLAPKVRQEIRVLKEIPVQLVRQAL
jgi:hypothetical protein